MTEKYSNPVPVAVALIPCDNKLVAIRRGIQPRLGDIAFPGGYISSGETFKEALTREAFEETGIQIAADEWKILQVGDSLQSNRILLFGVCRPIGSEKIHLDFRCAETLQVLLIDPTDSSIELAFDLHKLAMLEYLRSITISRR